MKKFKSIWMTLLVVVLSVAMVISGASLFAFAGAAPLAASTLTSNELVKNINIQSKVKYGESFDVPQGRASADEVSVTAPDGKKVTLNFNNSKATVKADQTGSYIVTYSAIADNDKEVNYDFVVYSYLEEEYEIKVDGNGAKIPTITAKGSTFKLPTAKLVWYDEDGEMHTVDGAAVKAIVGSGEEIDVSTEEKEYTANNSGLLYVRYFVQLESGKKFYSKDYTVRVQEKFTDNSAPTLSVVNVPTEANINKKVTLPTATASDDFDENIEIKVTVTFGNEAVKKVELDDNGFASKKLDAGVEFDNDKVMSFYPTETGTYKVIYQAVDDAGRTSAPHEYTVTCSDKSAPVFKDIDDFQIPDKWGLTVKTKDSNGTGDEVSVPATVKFPTPAIIDNAGNEGLTVSFKITNSDNTTVMSFDNILDTSEEGKGKVFKSNGANYGVAGESAEFKWDELLFDFNKVLNTDPKTDTYTAEYKAKDAKGNIATKTYKIAVENNYKDEKAPTTAEVETPAYIVVGGDQETFTVPTPSVADAEAATTRLKVEYTITSDASATGGYILTKAVKGGEEAEIIEDGGKYALEFDDGDKLLLNTKLEFSLKVTDSVGLSKSNTVADNTVAVVSPANVTNQLEISGAIADQNPNNGSAKPWEQKDKINAGGFSIKVKPSDRPFTGFDVTVKNPKGEELNNVTLETYYDWYSGMSDDDAKLVVRNLSFTPAAAGIYTVEVRAFNLGGVNTISVYPIEVKGSGNNGGSTENSAVSMPTTGSSYTAYALRNEKLTDISVTPGANEKLYMTYKINGGRFSLMGTEFIALNQGTYMFTDGYTVKDTQSNTVGAIEGRENYSIAITDTEQPAIEVQGLMPLYANKKTSLDDASQDVKLPAVVAVGEHGNAEVSIKIVDKDNGDVEAVKSADGSYYTFEPLMDGKYTVTYTATLNGGEPVTATFYINVGDVIAPDFTVLSAPAEKLKIGSEFTFSKLDATVDDGEQISDYTFTKKLIDPSKTEVSSATISGKGTTYANKADNGSKIKLDKSGTYTVVYEVSDKVGNKTTVQYEITVSAQKSSSNVSLTMISTVLIIVGVILIAGVIIYLVRYRKRKPKDNK